MSFVLQPWQLLVIILSAWMTKLQQELIDYVMTENGESSPQREVGWRAHFAQR